MPSRGRAPGTRRRGGTPGGGAGLPREVRGRFEWRGFGWAFADLRGWCAVFAGTTHPP
ncbi:hypothetical protein SCATT_p09230 (plasmid) [Streptantibioticus cattleyicolor NRRL 8057 = DSM 46488]|uniref:Uncharacterized protein n=1 Tax=Streptantibioticus cattleyicolor (strain ATCC 35852 / DSM 46488 / JCM 4925 / NBRC 14057 / NRRL 8057) TaxID=1003195 RepID=G8XDH0_STREN|nr:hypothetical protein SCATT_p09230 [Streptantibioticus cattleyicolor NRRL 8057 = DSM 46488]